MEELNFDSEEFKNSEAYKNFMSENSTEGMLKIQAYTANQAYPLEGVEIEVSKDIDGKKIIFFTGTTDSSGIIDDIMLPTVKSKDDINSKDDILYTEYHITANYSRSHVKKEYDVAMFDNIKIIQPIRIPITTLIEGDEN